jgi:Putative beta-barrel porin-2, OmpL-like. bbp2
MKSVSPQYITNITYWLDCEAKDTKVWTTLLTGPTSDDSNKNTTVVEFGILKNWNRYLYTIVDTQMVYSLGPVFGGPPPAGYIERAYDVYTYNGVHLNKCWDVTSRLEYYYDADGRGYAGGFGIPKTSYFGATGGFNYHPTKWVEFRPELRYDGATNPAFGGNAANLHRSQLTVSADILIKF